MKLKIIFLFSLLVFSSGCFERPAPEYTPSNQTFSVKEVHLGHAENQDFVTVVYLDNGQLKTVNNQQSQFYYDEINIYSVKDQSPYLVLNQIGSSENHEWGYPSNIYSLYVPENMTFTGTDTQYLVSSGKSHREETCTMS